MSVFYEGKGVGSITDNDGNYKVETRKGWNKLTFSAVGYVTKVVNIIPGVTKNLNVRMRPDDIMLDEVVVKPKREKYSRKNNPAVELMKKVIAHKKNNKLSENDYYQYNKYQKITMSLNDVTPEMLEKGMYKKMPFLKDQIELCEETNKFILPISVDETASQKIYRKHPKSEKTIIKGMSSTGVNELFATGDMLSTVLKDVFTDVNIYDNDIRLLQYPFISPISSSDAISFYKFYIMDTTFVDKDKCFHLTFVPNNSQDFGFTGHLYVLADSSYTVKKCTMNLPKKSGVNFVDNMDIIQEFEQLPNGEWVLKTDDMIVEMTLMKIMQGFQIRGLPVTLIMPSMSFRSNFSNVRGPRSKRRTHDARRRFLESIPAGSAYADREFYGYAGKASGADAGIQICDFCIEGVYRELCGNRDQGASQQGRYRSGKHHDLQ